MTTPDEYQQACLVVESKPKAPFQQVEQVRAVVGLLQIARDFGGLADEMKRHMFYEREMDFEAFWTQLDPEGRGFPFGDMPRLEGLNKEQKIRLLHAFLGLFSEVGEIADALHKHVVDGEVLDTINILEESGDLKWYDSILLDACDQKVSTSMHRNVEKLRRRYPAGEFDKRLAMNRDLDAERDAVEGR